MRQGNTALSYGLIAAGLGLLIVLLAGLRLGAWTMHFPWSLVVAGLAALTGAGLALLYSAAASDHLEEDGVHE